MANGWLNNSALRFLGGFLLGGLIGVAGGLLYDRRKELLAPGAVRDWAAALRRQCNETAVRAAEYGQNLTEQAPVLVEKTKAVLVGTAQEGRELAARATGEFRQRLRLTERMEA